MTRLAVTGRAINGVGLAYTYDALGRVTTEVNALGTFTYAYDGVSNRLTTATYPKGQTSTYSYLPTGQDHRLQTIHHKSPGGATLSKFDYTYDVVGNILTWQQQDDSAAPIVWEYGYDPADQLTAAIKKTTGSTPSVLQRLYYTYDSAGNRTVEQTDEARRSSSYDTLNRLTGQTPGGALHVAGTVNEPATVTIAGQPARVDAAGRFTGSVSAPAGTTTFTVQASDASGNARSQAYEVSQAGTAQTFTFDANGNLTGDGVQTFEWDAMDRLVAVTVGTNRSEFTFDGLSRRTRIVEKASGATVREAQFVWDGTDVIEERLSTGEIARLFESGEQHNGTARYLTRDHLGSVREVTEGSGAVVTRNDYDPYGRVTRVAGTSDSRFGYTGHLYHAPGGLALALFRGYDPALGRWVSQDPIGLLAGPNLYRYVSNSPANWIDPLGQDQTIPGTRIRVRLDMRQQPFPNMHITWPDGTETIVNWKGGWDRKHGGKDLVPPPMQYRDKVRPVIKNFVKKAAKVVCSKAPVIGIATFGYDWYTEGVGYAVDEATWPVSAAWSNR